MKLEVGKKYKTRLGHKAFVFSVKGFSQEAIGFIELHDGRRKSSQWFADGTFFKDRRESGNDIVAEWSDTPDPGEGWRLLHSDEDLEEGDELWSQLEQTWFPSLQSQTIQNHGWCYRRRIAPEYVPYTWEDREELRGRWYRKKGDNSEFMVNYITRHNESEICIGPWLACEFLGGCEWLDSTPCGKAVT